MFRAVLLLHIVLLAAATPYSRPQQKDDLDYILASLENEDPTYATAKPEIATTTRRPTALGRPRGTFASDALLNGTPMGALKEQLDRQKVAAEAPNSLSVYSEPAFEGSPSYGLAAPAPAFQQNPYMTSPSFYGRVQAPMGFGGFLGASPLQQMLQERNIERYMHFMDKILELRMSRQAAYRNQMLQPYGGNSIFMNQMEQQQEQQ